MRGGRDLLASLLIFAGAGCHACHTCDECDGIEKYCCVEAEAAKEDETCWEIECRDVCIPKVHFPWDDCRKPRCGKVRRVAVLTEETYEVDGCEYEWTIYPQCATGEPTKAEKAAPSACPPVPPAPAPPAR